MDYERKYKEALGWMRSVYDGLHGATKEDAEHYFPELKESEEERIKKALIKILNEIVINTNYKELGIDYNIRDMITWLEKQGEKKSADKTTSKFKVGDWIVGNDGIFKITQYEDEYGYELTDTTGYVAHFISPDYVESNFHLWTIQDAKNGDVLDCKGNIKDSNGIKYERICLFNNLDNAFFTLTRTSNYVEDFDIDVNIDYPDNTTPATKGQKEILFMAMKEAGYEWDADKKELKKIEPKKLDADKVIAWLVANICDFEYYVNLFKKDFGL